MTEWSRYVAYKCDYCTEDCINLRDSNPASHGLCRACFQYEPDVASEVSAD